MPRGAHISRDDMPHAFRSLLEGLCGNDCELRYSYPLSRLTTLRIGGPADALVTPRSEGALLRLLSGLSKVGVPYYILGNGSNLLAPDSGYRGVLVCTAGLVGLSLADGVITASCGARLPAIAHMAEKGGISGFSSLAGIPATLGGAVFMNAGAGGETVGERILSVRVAPMRGGSPFVMQGGECAFAYRDSIFRHRGLVVLSAELSGEPLSPLEIAERTREAQARRRATQPLDLPNAGSAFRRPKGDYAGRLIEAAGLKGYRVGGAAISEKHAGFVVNLGGATSHDVRTLIEEVRSAVLEKFGVLLEKEIEFLGEE